MTEPETSPPPKLWIVAACSAVQAVAGIGAAGIVASEDVVLVWKIIPAMVAIGLTLMVIGDLKVIAASRGRPAGWSSLGLLGPIGVVVVACLPRAAGARGFPIVPLQEQP